MKIHILEAFLMSERQEVQEEYLYKKDGCRCFEAKQCVNVHFRKSLDGDYNEEWTW